jgi:hypothetical protein
LEKYIGIAIEITDSNTVKHTTMRMKNGKAAGPGDIPIEFDVHGSVHHGNVYVQLKVQLDVHVFICIIYSYPFFSSTCFGCYLHPSSGWVQIANRRIKSTYKHMYI